MSLNELTVIPKKAGQSVIASPTGIIRIKYLIVRLEVGLPCAPQLHLLVVGDDSKVLHKTKHTYSKLLSIVFKY